MPLNSSDILTRYSAGGNIPVLKSDFTGITNDIINLNDTIVQNTPTGVIQDYVGSSAPTGWLLCSGLTIGSVASSATARNNADTQTLFELLWTNFSNTELIIQDSSGTPTTRGASASADFSANKRMPLPDLRGRVVAGRGNMGGSTGTALNNFAHTTQGAAFGSQSHALALGELAQHNHGVNESAHTHGYTEPNSGAGHSHGITDPQHSHTTDNMYGVGSGNTNVNTGTNVGVVSNLFVSLTSRTMPTGITINNGTIGITINGNTTGITIQNTGSSTAHNNTQPTYILSKIIKL